MKILLADDHTLVRENLRDFLMRLVPDARILEAASLDEAMTVATSAGQIDLIILDLVMPGMNGLAGLREMIGRFPEVPVVMLSGTIDKNVVFGAMEAGARGFVPKSMSGRAMLDCLRLIMNGETYVPMAAISDRGGQDSMHASMALLQKGALAALTPREREVLDALKVGRSNKKIARLLGIQEVTVKVHLQHIFEKLGVSNRVEAVSLALTSYPGTTRAPR